LSRRKTVNAIDQVATVVGIMKAVTNNSTTVVMMMKLNEAVALV
jgi:hypothetical protein